jgi:hypothetical protein
LENTVTVSKTYRVQSGSEIDPPFIFRSAIWQILEPFLRYQPGDDLNVDLITKSIPDEERRSTLAAYLKDQPIEGMLSYYKANYPVPPYQSEAPHDFILNVPTLIIWGIAR